MDEIIYNLWRAWDGLGYEVILTVSKSYQYDGSVIMKGCMQWNLIYN